MPPTNLDSGLNLTALAASFNAVTPVTSHTYQIQNLAFSHVLENWNSATTDNNPIVAATAPSTVPTNMQFKYYLYPSSSGETVFTLQSTSTLNAGGNATISNRGGYLRLNTNTNKLVHGGQPMAWKLTQVAPQIYKILPFDDVFSENGRFIATDSVSSCCSLKNQVTLQQDVSSFQQFWTFS